MLAAAIALQAAAHLRRRPAAEIVLALDRAADVDLVGAALGHLAARARRLRQALVDGGPHRRPAQRGIGGLRRRPARSAGAESERAAASAVCAPAPISWAWRAIVVCGAAVAAWSRRFWTRASALRLTSSSAFLRASSSARRFLCSSSAFLRASSSTARRAASSAARWRATSASRLASTRARARASFSSSVRVRSTMPPPPEPGRRRARTRRRGPRRRAGAPPPSFRVRPVGAAAGASVVGAGAGAAAAALARRRRRPLDRLLDLDRHRARPPVREFLAHLRRVAALGRRAAARRGREGQRLGRLGLFFLFRHIACCPWSAPARQPALFSR